MKIGYARVSTRDQSLDLQIDSLNQDGCGRIFSEEVSGAKSDRPQLNAMLNHIRKGDTVVVWKLDRLGRSIKDLIRLVSMFEEDGVGFRSIQDNIDTTTPTGKLIFHLFAALAEFERDIISQRTKAGLEAARARGRKGGRPKGLSSTAKDKARIAESLYHERDKSVGDICDHLGISKPTLYRYLRYRGVKIAS
jgi:DNA invertase Pin-like site-specific DNA recombinase